jgi:hypothetical protein
MLFSQYTAIKIIDSMRFSATQLDGNPSTAMTYDAAIEYVAAEKSKIVETGVKTVIFLFVTLTVIAICLMQGNTELTLFGLTIKDKHLFIFASFMVGNVLYVSCTGLYFKIFVYEFMMLELVKRHSGKRLLHGFMHSFHSNVFSYLQIFGIHRDGGLTEPLMAVTNFYTKYFILLAYGMFYYGTLGTFIIILWFSDDWIDHLYLYILLGANIMSGLTSASIFWLADETDLQR